MRIVGSFPGVRNWRVVVGLIVMWGLFFAYLNAAREREPVYAGADARAMELVRRHVRSASPDPFGGAALTGADSINGRRTTPRCPGASK